MSNQISTQKKQFSLSRSLRFAWLIRQDVRDEHDLDDIEAQKDFIVWWAMYGQKEYPESDAFTDELKNVLFETLEDYPQQGKFGMNRLLLHIYRHREDVQKEHEIQTIAGVIGLNQWFYIYGIKEYQCTGFLSSEILEALNKPVAGFWQAEVDSELPKLSPLMFFLWSIREDIKKAFDLNNREGRERYLGWFFLYGVEEAGLASLLDDYWLEWINEKILLQEAMPVRRIGLLAWSFQKKIRKNFDLKSQQGRQGLIDWTEDALKTESAYQWIKPLIELQNNRLGVNLIGFAFGELGIGEDVRMAAAACKNAGIPYNVINIKPGEKVRQNDQVLANEITEQVSQLKYQTNIFCLTGFDTAHVYLEKGRQLFENRYNIGWWPWELPVWPEQWGDAFDLIDEVWAATSYTQNMYQQATDKPVTLMPLAVSVERAVPVSRKELGLPKNKFLFLYTFDFNSYLDRKNPHAAVKAFVKAFSKENEQVGLVLKTMNSDVKNPKWKAFQKLCQKDERIVLLEKTLDREKVLGLINACDAYISLHRAEGFGRTPAEALLFGKPVIATDFSGNTDFLTPQTGFPVKWRKKAVKEGEYPFIKKKSKAYWAEPDISHAAEQMQAALKAANNKSVRQKIQQFALQQFSLSRIGGLMKKRLMKIKQNGH